jgi:membrane fusion protein, macrolide-specific efflux system
VTATKKRWRKWPWLVGLTLLGAGGATAFAWQQNGQDPLDPELLITVERGTHEIEILETGRIEAKETVELKSKVAGRVAAVHVDEGQRVEKGQLLMTLDTTDYARDVARAQARAAQAKNAIDLAKLTSERAERGLAGGVVSKADAERLGFELEARRLELSAALVELAAARDRLDDTEITSPIDGTVILRGIEPGEVVSPGVEATFDGKPLLTVANLSTLIVKIELNQIDVARVAVGQKLALVLDAIPDERFEAVLTKIAPASVRPAGKDIDVFPIEAELSAGDGRIKPGMTADVRIHIDSKSGVISLPIEAVVKVDGEDFVTTIVDEGEGKVRRERIAVATGSKNDRSVEITSGLEEGQKVLVDPPSASDNEAKL